ncbi:hypothetical protein EJB05_34239, partial [Eragrostis curvula]
MHARRRGTAASRRVCVLAARSADAEVEPSRAPSLARALARGTLGAFDLSMRHAFHGRGRGFFAFSRAVPYDQAIDFHDQAGKIFTILSPSGARHQVRLELVGDEILFTEGWPGVVASEEIEELDVGFFARSGDLGIRMVVYKRTGEEKGDRPHSSFFFDLDVNEGCGNLFDGKVGQPVTIVGPSGRQHAVTVERMQGQTHLVTGWDMVARIEGIEQMDVGHFYSEIEGRFELTVFNRSGVQKPPYNGPVPDAVADSFVPWKEVRYERQLNTDLTPFVKHRMHCLWINSQKHFKLYVGQLTRAQEMGPWMHFTNAFSYSLPENCKLMMRFSGRAVEYEATVARVHGSARIVDGWSVFVEANNIAAGSVYIFKFFRLGGLLRLTVYNA